MRFLLPVLILVLVSCAHQKAKEPAQSNALEEALKRESGGLTEQKAVSPDGLFSFTVNGKAAPEVRYIKDKVSYYYAKTDIGAEGPMECFFYDSDVHPAMALKNLINNALGNEKTLGKLERKEVAQFGAGAISGSPFLMLMTSYLTQDKKFGLLKSMVATRENSAVICIHNEVGYRQTFLNAFAELAASYKFENRATVVPFYKDVLVLTFQNVPVGFVTNYLVNNESGNEVWVARTSMLLPEINNSDVSTFDSSELEVSGSDGKVQVGRYTMEDDLRSSLSIQISSGDGKEYLVKGFSNAKYISSKMKTNGIVSRYAHTLMLRKNIFKEHIQQFTVPVYSPNDDLYQPIKLRTFLKETRENSAVVRMDFGKMTTTALVDLEGAVEEITIPVGKLEFKGKRVFKSGALNFP